MNSKLSKLINERDEMRNRRILSIKFPTVHRWTIRSTLKLERINDEIAKLSAIVAPETEVDNKVWIDSLINNIDLEDL